MMHLREVLCSAVFLVWAADLGRAQTAPADLPAPAPATAPTTAPAVDAERHWDPPFGLKSKTASGDWFGLRPALKDVGIETQFFWQNNFTSVLKGGLSTGGGKNNDTIDWIITADLDKMRLIKDADLFVHARAGWGYSVNDYTGTTKQQDVIDDADGLRTLYIDQLWYRQYLLNRKIAVQFGYMDFQTVVDRNAYANSEDKQFMNTALDNNPLVPTAAITSIGGAVYIHPVSWYTLLLAAGDAQGPTPTPPRPVYKPGFSTAFHDEAWFVSWLENIFSFKFPSACGELPGNYRFGMVYDPRVRPIFRPKGLPPADRGSDYGFYTSLDQMVFREDRKSDQGLGIFFRYGFRHGDINRFDDFWSTGLSYTGLVPERDKDVLGFGIAQLRTSPEYRSRVNRYSGAETVYELYYAIQLTPSLVLTPDIQYVDNPGAADTLSNAIVGSIRLRVSF